ncbi:MAG TPA: hypothetical protein VLT86_13605 [Vicinamibacterales bacterium]|nr:hypothetical protein [Vicinamibacterales bacterium]
MRSLAFIALIGLIAIPTLAAQSKPLLTSHPGAWQPAPPITPRLPQDLSVGERAAITASVNQLLEIVRRMPAMAPPAGLAVVPHAFVDLLNLDHSEGKRVKYVTAEIVVNLAPFEPVGRGGAVEAVEADRAAGLTLRVNDLAVLLGSETGMADDQGAFIQRPEDPVDTIHGYPVYEEGNGERWVMIRRNEVPFFAPVTAERYMRATIAAHEKELADVRDRRARVPAGVPASVVATIDEAIASFGRRLKNDQDALAAMSPADRAAPARLGAFSGEEAPVFAPADDTGATAVVYFNPALMSPGLPRTAPQLLSVNISASDDTWPGLKARLGSEVDWSALEKFVHQQ